MSKILPFGAIQIRDGRSSNPERRIMATKKKVNKSEEIRKYATNNPSSSAKEVVAALKKKGIIVSAPTVATVKSKAGIKKQKRKSTNSKTRTARTSQPASPVSVELLCAAKKLAVQAGSMESAIAALRAVEKIDSVSA